MSIAIRAATDDDFEAIAAITNYYIEHTSIHFGDTPETAVSLGDKWRGDRARYPWLVAADEGGEIVGYAKAGVFRERAAYRFTTEAGIYLAHDRVGAGIGRALYARLLDEIAARDFRSVIAGITLPNDASVRLHERLGFVAVGVVRDAGYKLGAWHDVGFWQLCLRARH
jgi:phosphinothricin acetyltransferase